MVFPPTIGIWRIKRVFSKLTLAPLVSPPSRCPVPSLEAFNSDLRIFLPSAGHRAFSVVSPGVDLVPEKGMPSPHGPSCTRLFLARMDHMDPVPQTKSCGPGDMARVWYQSRLTKNLALISVLSRVLRVWR